MLERIHDVQEITHDRICCVDLEFSRSMSPCNSIAGLYFEGTCDVMSFTMATHKVLKNVH